MRILSILAVLVALAGTARADVVTYTVEGRAAGDETTGRTAALDQAFELAAMDAVDAVMTSLQQKQWLQELKTEIFARARLWVASFKVKSTKQDGGDLVLTVDVRVDVDKLRVKLVELGVALEGALEPTSGDDAPIAARDAVLLLRVTTVEGATYTFGDARDDGVPGAADAEASLARRGLALVPVAAAGSTRAEGLPIGDDAARALARDADAEVAIIAAVEIGAPGRVRGATGVAALARAQVRAIDVASGRVLGTAQAARGSTGTAAAEVSANAVRAALLEALAVALPRREPAAAAPALPLPAAGKNEVLVRIRGATGAETEAIRAYLVDAKVKKVSLRRIAGDEIVYAVLGSKAAHLVSLIAGGADLHADARAVDGAVEVMVEAPDVTSDLPSVGMPW